MTLHAGEDGDAGLVVRFEIQKHVMKRLHGFDVARVTDVRPVDQDRRDRSFPQLQYFAASMLVYIDISPCSSRMSAPEITFFQFSLKSPLEPLPPMTVIWLWSDS